MLPGLHVGAAATVHVTVTPAMVATFDELGPVHPVYSTWNLVRHMEEASRKLILPFLEPFEEAVGYRVEVTHLAPALVGRRVEVTAYLAELDDRQIVCDVTAHSGRALIGRGRTVQVMTTKTRLAQRLRDLEQES